MILKSFLSLPLFRPSVFRVVFFFYILIYRGYYTLYYYTPCHDFKAYMEEEKTIQDDKKYNQKQHSER